MFFFTFIVGLASQQTIFQFRIRLFRCNAEVIKVDPTIDHDSTGRWTLSIKSSHTEAVTKEDFDAVLVCIGHHVYPKIPKFPGQEKFKGIIMHTHSLKSCENFKGKDVVVVGIGNSAVDAAVDCTFHAKSVSKLLSSKATIIFENLHLFLQ